MVVCVPCSIRELRIRKNKTEHAAAVVLAKDATEGTNIRVRVRVVSSQEDDR